VLDAIVSLLSSAISVSSELMDIVLNALCLCMSRPVGYDIAIEQQQQQQQQPLVAHTSAGAGSAGSSDPPPVAAEGRPRLENISIMFAYFHLLAAAIEVEDSGRCSPLPVSSTHSSSSSSSSSNKVASMERSGSVRSTLSPGPVARSPALLQQSFPCSPAGGTAGAAASVVYPISHGGGHGNASNILEQRKLCAELKNDALDLIFGTRFMRPLQQLEHRRVEQSLPPPNEATRTLQIHALGAAAAPSSAGVGVGLGPAAAPAAVPATTANAAYNIMAQQLQQQQSQVGLQHPAFAADPRIPHHQRGPLTRMELQEATQVHMNVVAGAGTGAGAAVEGASRFSADQQPGNQGPLQRAGESSSSAAATSNNTPSSATATAAMQAVNYSANAVVIPGGFFPFLRAALAVRRWRHRRSPAISSLPSSSLSSASPSSSSPSSLPPPPSPLSSYFLDASACASLLVSTGMKNDDTHVNTAVETQEEEQQQQQQQSRRELAEQEAVSFHLQQMGLFHAAGHYLGNLLVQEGGGGGDGVGGSGAAATGALSASATASSSSSSHAARRSRGGRNIWRPTEPLAVGDLVDAQDREKCWFESIVLEISADGSVKVHFMGWGSKWDDVIGASELLTRLAPLNSKTKNWRADLFTGGLIEIKCNDDLVNQKWMWGRVTALNVEEAWVEVSYLFSNEPPVIKRAWLFGETICPVGMHTKDKSKAAAGQTVRPLKKVTPANQAALFSFLCICFWR
jgi:hypothetical protein